MNYSAHYERLMARARDRVLPGYRERHHILPRCMGGTGEPKNLVDLTPEEHYVAHQLLVKIHPNVDGLATAAVRMAKQSVGRKAYGWLRRRHAAAIAARMRGNTHSLGVTSWNKGRSPSDETRSLISAALKGRKVPAETIAKRPERRNNGLKGRTLTAEHRARLSESVRAAWQLRGTRG